MTCSYLGPFSTSMGGSKLHRGQACQRHGYGIQAMSVIKFSANNSRFVSSLVNRTAC